MSELNRVVFLTAATAATAFALFVPGCTGETSATAEKAERSAAALEICSDYPVWQQGVNYVTGDIVRYTNGNYYRAAHDNPGYDPTVSTWYWELYSCTGGGTDAGTGGGGGSSGFVVSEQQFQQMFPNRNPFYTYKGMVDGTAFYPAFAKTGDDNMRKREAAAFLANVAHETGELVYVKEIDQSAYPTYCDPARPYGCPAGQAAYYGRGPLQLSWNFNYKTAGDSLGIDLLNNPSLVETDPAVSWGSGLWFWNTQTGAGTMTAHDAIVNNRGFGETIRTINGARECGGGNPTQVQRRIDFYNKYVQILGTTPGDNLGC